MRSVLLVAALLPMAVLPVAEAAARDRPATRGEVEAIAREQARRASRRPAVDAPYGLGSGAASSQPRPVMPGTRAPSAVPNR